VSLVFGGKLMKLTDILMNVVASVAIVIWWVSSLVTSCIKRVFKKDKGGPYGI
jgi:hypothetical protein